MLQRFAQAQRIPDAQAVIEVAALHGSFGFPEVTVKGEFRAPVNVAVKVVAQRPGLLVHHQRAVDGPLRILPYQPVAGFGHWPSNPNQLPAVAHRKADAVEVSKNGRSGLCRIPE